MSGSTSSSKRPRRKRLSKAHINREFGEIAASLSELEDLPDIPSNGPRDYRLAKDVADEHYAPPTPPPVDIRNRHQWWWILAIGAPVAAIVLLIVWPAAPWWIYLVFAALALTAWAIIFARLPRTHRDIDDDGAQL